MRDVDHGVSVLDNMRTRLVALGAGIIVYLALGLWIYTAAFAPIDDPGYFCGGPDPSPVTSIAATYILQDCAAGKTFTVAKGQTIAVDLQGGNGVDTSIQWTDVTGRSPSGSADDSDWC